MTHTYLTFALFIMVACGTPGPNNIMLLHSGLHFGWRRTLPHILGYVLGASTLLMGISLGLGSLLTCYPTIDWTLKVVATGYLGYLSYYIMVHQIDLKEQSKTRKPLSFLKAVLFQWVNPKCWGILMVVTSLYPTWIAQSLPSIMLIAGCIGLICACLWAKGGTLLHTFLVHPARLVWFNRVMGVLVIMSVIPLFF